MADGDAALLHRSGSERGKSNHVARGINIWNGGAIVFVNGNVAAIVDGEAGFFESKTIHSGAAACRKERGVGLERLAALHRKAHASGGILNFYRTLVEQEAHAESREAVAETIGNFSVEKRQAGDRGHRRE